MLAILKRNLCRGRNRKGKLLINLAPVPTVVSHYTWKKDDEIINVGLQIDRKQMTYSR